MQVHIGHLMRHLEDVSVPSSLCRLHLVWVHPASSCGWTIVFLTVTCRMFALLLIFTITDEAQLTT